MSSGECADIHIVSVAEAAASAGPLRQANMSRIQLLDGQRKDGRRRLVERDDRCCDIGLSGVSVVCHSKIRTVEKLPVSHVIKKSIFI